MRKQATRKLTFTLETQLARRFKNVLLTDRLALQQFMVQVIEQYVTQREAEALETLNAAAQGVGEEPMTPEEYRERVAGDGKL